MRILIFLFLSCVLCGESRAVGSFGEEIQSEQSKPNIDVWGRILVEKVFNQEVPIQERAALLRMLFSISEVTFNQFRTKLSLLWSNSKGAEVNRPYLEMLALIRMALATPDLIELRPKELATLAGLCFVNFREFLDLDESVTTTPFEKNRRKMIVKTLALFAESLMVYAHESGQSIKIWSSEDGSDFFKEMEETRLALLQKNPAQYQDLENFLFNAEAVKLHPDLLIPMRQRGRSTLDGHPLGPFALHFRAMELDMKRDHRRN